MGAGMSRVVPEALVGSGVHPVVAGAGHYAVAFGQLASVLDEEAQVIGLFAERTGHEWTTGSSVFAGNQGYSPFWRELVVHFLDWTTSSFDFAGNLGYSPICRELVVHLPEWSTSSFVFAGNLGNSPF